MAKWKLGGGNYPAATMVEYGGGNSLRMFTTASSGFGDEEGGRMRIGRNTAELNWNRTLDQYQDQYPVQILTYFTPIILPNTCHHFRRLFQRLLGRGDGPTRDSGRMWWWDT